MSALVALPHREAMQAVILARHGTGWRVGIGPLVAGTVDRDISLHLGEKEAVRAAMALADTSDLIAVRA